MLNISNIINFKLLLPVFLCIGLITGQASSQDDVSIKAGNYLQTIKLHTTLAKRQKKVIHTEKINAKNSLLAKKRFEKKISGIERIRAVAKIKKVVLARKKQVIAGRKKLILSANEDKKAFTEKVIYRDNERSIIFAEHKILRNSREAKAICVVPGLGIFTYLSEISTGNSRNLHLTSLQHSIESNSNLNRLTQYYISGTSLKPTTATTSSIEVTSLPETDNVIVFLQAVKAHGRLTTSKHVLTSQKTLIFGAKTLPNYAYSQDGIFFTKGTTVGSYTFAEDCTLRVGMSVDEFLNTLANLTNGKNRPIGAKK